MNTKYHFIDAEIMKPEHQVKSRVALILNNLPWNEPSYVPTSISRWTCLKGLYGIFPCKKSGTWKNEFPYNKRIIAYAD